MFKRNRIFMTIFSIVLFCFTAYVLADTFLITRVYSQAETAESSETEEHPGYSVSATITGEESTAEASKEDTQEEMSADNTQTGESANDAQEETDSDADTPFSSEKIVTDTSYQDENISITLTETEYCGSAVYVADIQVSDPSYLKTAFAQNAYGRNVTDETSSIADDVDAILAINGDYYGAQERGYVIRNGVIYRDTAESGQQDLVIKKDGSFEIIYEDEISAEELLADGAVQVLSFGPALVADGSIQVSENEEVGRAMRSNPRTAIGIIDECHYVFVVSDGRTNESEGLSLYELAQFMESLGVETAYNLDGGGSSTMVFNGQVINNPTSGHSIKERKVSDIVYIGY